MNNTGWPDAPYGWIQAKGSQLCIDIHCTCGRLSHIDDEFVYYVECPCGQQYEVDYVVKLTPTQNQLTAVKAQGEDRTLGFGEGKT